MALLLLATEFPRQLPDAAFYHGLDRLPSALHPKILRYRRWEDAHAALLGKLLLLVALNDTGSTATLDQLLYTPQDKPYFPAGPNFNISHSGNRVVCALSTTGRIGVDIERVKPLSFEDFQTQFTPNEWQAIRGAQDPIAAFYRFWTAKESLIKADGRGLGIPLLELDVTEYRPITLDGAIWTFRPLSWFPGYAAHLTTEEPNPEIRFRELDPVTVAAGL
ncbi:MAG TPA: 4'-phosphopantetheinyl transferase superfamily protein [Puia sp.]|uniref:4'-phosphopantetheinyl transferase family protein n=1 Tax=Puia sp. TaxID=2045100 RepID=UPI002CF7B4A1|nr:4'-phosphopantetheinyl transferase superfamily protein [Puia sp.]HVU95563.1 4'-phosphopantetheinyl transferase superfamily protein [Puia sp.]